MGNGPTSYADPSGESRAAPRDGVEQDEAEDPRLAVGRVEARQGEAVRAGLPRIPHRSPRRAQGRPAIRTVEPLAERGTDQAVDYQREPIGTAPQALARLLGLWDILQDR